MVDDLGFDLEEKSLGELEAFESRFSRQVEAEIKGSKAKGGAGIGKLDRQAQRASGKQVAVQSEIQDRLFDIHQDRSLHAQEVDEELKATRAPSAEAWADEPSRWDWPGIDTPR